MAAEHIEELVKQVARSGVEMASKCGTLEQLRTEFKSLQRCLELGEADDVARSRAEAAAFDLWNYCVMEANRLRRSGVSSRHGESRDSNQQQMSDPVSVEHVQARAIASHLIAATIPTGAQISSEERTEYNLLAARSLHETGRMWQQLSMVEQADAYYSHAMEHIEPLLAHEVPTSRNEGSSAYLQQLWHQARTQGFEISASRLTNAWLLGGRQVGLACELEKQAVSLGLEICSSYSSSPSGSAGLDAPEAATILRLSKALLARAIGMATSSSPADNSAHSVGTGPEDQARLVEAALQLASAMEQVGKIRGSDEMTSPPHPVYDFAEDLKIKALTMLAALRLDMGTPESIASARRYVQALISARRNTGMGRGEEDGTTPQALLLQAQVAAAECNAAEARGAILDLALHPQTTQEMLASGVTSFLAFLFSKPNLISEELLEGGIKPVIQMLPDKPRQMAERPEGYPGEGGRLTGAVAATAAADICDCILHQAQGGNEELEKVVLGLVEKVDFAAASEADKRDGPAGPSSSQSAALRRLVVAMWNKGAEHFSSKHYSRAERFFRLLGGKGMPQLSNSFVSATQLPAAAANEAAPHVAGSAAKAWCTAALCCIGLKRPSAALEALDRADELEPLQSHCAFVRLKALCQLKDSRAAAEQIRTLASCSDFQPGYLRIACDEAKRCGLDGVAEEALKALQRSLQEQHNVSHGKQQPEGLTEGAVIRSLLRLSLSRMRSICCHPPGSLAESEQAGGISPSHDNNKEKGPSRAGQDCKEENEGEAAVDAVDEVAGLFSLARRRLRRLGVEVFFGPLESPGTCAEAQWFANSAWTSAKDTSRLAERLGSNRMWQACASLWLAAAELLEAACGLTADAGASGRDQLRHWRTLSYILGGMAALEAREGLAGENEGDINDAADEETRAGALMMAKEMLEGGSRSISTSEEVTQEAQTDMAWLHYLRFRVAVANGAQVLEQTEMLREAAALPGMDSALFTLYATLCLKRHTSTHSRHSSGVAVTALHLLLQRLVEEVAEGAGADPAKQANGAVRIHETLRTLVDLAVSDKDRLSLFRQATHLMSSNDCLAQVASADVEWLFVSAYNRGVALAAQPGRGRDAEEFLSAALGLQRAARVLLQREADVKMALQAVQSMAMSSHPATSNPCVDKGDPDVSPQPSTFSSCG